MTSLIVVLCVAVLGVQCVTFNFLLGRIAALDASAVHNANRRISDYRAIASQLRLMVDAIAEHDTSSALLHAQTHSATKHFEDTVVDVQAQAEQLRQHAQQFLDRSEAAATSTRQVVNRG